MENLVHECRIYVVVADTVQHPLAPKVYSRDLGSDEDNQLTRFERQEDTRSITQPAGRCAAQVGHVVSKTRVAMIKDYLKRELNSPGAYRRIKRTEWFWEEECEPITTIVKAARDSYELNHVYNLLLEAKIPVYEFEDENPDAYGPGKVRTAIATVPIIPGAVDGILDYLPLWWRSGGSQNR